MHQSTVDRMGTRVFICASDMRVSQNGQITGGLHRKFSVNTAGVFGLKCRNDTTDKFLLMPCLFCPEVLDEATDVTRFKLT